MAKDCRLQDCYDQEGILIKPISLYVRGNVQHIIDFAFEQNLLLYKKTDYKSKVKYHGEFVVYPNNDGTFLPEFPVDKCETEARKVIIRVYFISKLDGVT